MMSVQLPADLSQPVLSALLNAFELSQDLGLDRWDFALELSEFTAAGLSRNRLRWLICREYVLLALSGLHEARRGALCAR
jgi:hypothetical protein